MNQLELDALLDVAADLVVDDGFDALTLSQVAARSRLTHDDVLAAYGSMQDLMVAMLNREFTRIWTFVVDSIDRDPRGGLLSRIYRYTLAGVYEQPLTRALYLMDRNGLHTIMRAAHGLPNVPSFVVRPEFIVRMKEVGMVRPDVDALELSAMLSAVSAGAALTAPYSQIDHVNAGLTFLLERSVDADVVDTQPGKTAFITYTTRLAAPDGPH